MFLAAIPIAAWLWWSSQRDDETRTAAAAGLVDYDRYAYPYEPWTVAGPSEYINMGTLFNTYDSNSDSA